MTMRVRDGNVLSWRRALLALLLGGVGPAALAVTVCPPAVVEGVDVSAGQGTVTWSGVQGSGRGFAYAFATQGNTITDARFASNWPAIKTAGMVRGALHFFDPTVDGVTQANYFLAAINAAGGLDKIADLPAALDLECPTSSVQGSADADCVAPGNSGWVAHATLVQRVFDWLTTVHEATGKRPVIYTYPAWYADAGFADLRLARYPVFVASYAACAEVPAPWSTAAFWQYSATGTVPGIAGNSTYLDRYVGAASGLQALVETLFTHGFEGLSQLITFTSTTPAAAKVGGTYNVTASANSGLPVSLNINASASSVCSIASGTVSFLAVGTCRIDGTQAGDATWNAAPPAQQSFGVTKTDQTISFSTTAPNNAVFAGTPYDVAATATSGLVVAFTVDASATSVCSLSGSSVSFIGAGTCVINADQAGDATWAAAPQVQQSFAVAKADQTITFISTAPSVASVGGPDYAAAATATSTLPVTLSIDASAAAVCSIGAGGVSFIGAGSCVVNADQPGNASYNPAPQVQQTFNVNTCISLALGQVVKASMPSGASVCINNTAGIDTEYTYLPINFHTFIEYSLSLTGTGIQAVTGPPSPRPAPSDGELALAPLQEAMASMASEMHGVETPAAFPADHVVTAADLLKPHGATATPLTVGQLIDLNSPVGNCGTTPVPRKGRVEAITTAQSPGQPLLYAVQDVVETTAGAGDWHPPVVGGYTTPYFQSIIDAVAMAPPGNTVDPDGGGPSSGLLKTGFLDIATANFGAQTDLDNNGGLILFFTPTLNELSPPASSQVVQGMFQWRDLYSTVDCPASNQGEILYMMVPDPTGVVNSNVRTVSFVYGNAPVTLVHFYEHLISAWRRTYAPGGQLPLEAPWLDEALAWQGQELAFWSASVGLAPRNNIVVGNLTTGPNAAVRVNDFNTYENPMYGNSRNWFFQLSSTNNNRRVGPLRQLSQNTGTTPTVHENAAPTFTIGYTFMRYLLDRKNTGDAALLNALVNSPNTGLTNLQTVFGQTSMDDWLGDFLVAIYTDDAVAGVAPQYTLASWNMRSLYTALNGSYQLAVDPLTNNTPFNFAIGYGGGTRYTRFGIPSGGTATLTLTEGGSTPPAAIGTALVRTK